jgi:hypothetical protein
LHYQRNVKRINAATTEQLVSFHTKKIVASILSKRFESKIEEVREDQFGFQKDKGSRYAIGLMRIILERGA